MDTSTGQIVLQPYRLNSFPPALGGMGTAGQQGGSGDMDPGGATRYLNAPSVPHASWRCASTTCAGKAAWPAHTCPHHQVRGRWQAADGSYGYPSAVAPSTRAPVIPAWPGWPEVATTDPRGPSAVLRPKPPMRLDPLDRWTGFAFHPVKAWRATIISFSHLLNSLGHNLAQSNELIGVGARPAPDKLDHDVAPVEGQMIPDHFSTEINVGIQARLIAYLWI